MKKLIATVKKYPKDSAMTLTAICVGIMAVMGIHFADVAKKPFWWNFWIVLNVICILSILAAWAYAWSQSRRNRHN